MKKRHLVKDHKTFLFFLFLFSLLTRVLVFEFFLSKERRYFDYDSDVYNNVALNIAENKGLVNDDGSPHFYRVPGYSFFLSTVYRICGVNEVVAMWLQVFFASFIPLLIFFLSMVLFPGYVLLAKTVSIYSVIHMGYLLFSGLMMTETFFSLFFLLFLIFFFSEKLFFAGCFLGLVSLIRPVGHYLIWLLLVMILCSRGGMLYRVKKCGIFFGSWLFVVGGWLLRNYLLTGCIFFHTLPGVHFLRYAAIPIDMQVNKTSYEESEKKLFKKERGDLIKEAEEKKRRPLYEIEQCNLAQKLAVKYLLKYPFLSIKRALWQMTKTLISPYSLLFNNLYKNKGMYFLRYRRSKSAWKDLWERFLFPVVFNNNLIQAIVWIEKLLIYFILIGFFGFLFLSFFDIHLLAVTLKIIPIICFFIIITFAFGFERLRIPIEPLLMLGAGYFWLHVGGKREH